jgi:hypothetical protein
MFSRMLKLPEAVRRAYDLSSLEVAIHAAAPCPVPVKRPGGRAAKALRANRDFRSGRADGLRGERLFHLVERAVD